MKIGIDAHFVTRLPRRGIGTYSLNLICAMVKCFPQFEFFLYIRHSDTDAVLPVGPNVHIRKIPAPLDPLWEQLILPLAARRDRVDVLHSLGNTGPLLVAKTIKQVISVMDVMFLQSGNLVPKPVTIYQNIGRVYRSIVSPRCSRNASAVITISEYSKRDISQFISNLQPSRLHVTHLSCDPLFKDDNLEGDAGSYSDYHLARLEPFILCLGADDPRKNTLRVVRAFLKLIAENNIEQNLVVVGYRNWEASLAYKAVVSADAKQRVKFLPFISTRELASLYRNATLFVYPSVYEGFGIPILEAFNTGCPVITSATTSMPEIGGDAALYINPESTDELAAAVLRVVTEPLLRISMKNKGKSRAQQFCWDRTAQQTVEVYKHSLMEK